MMKDLTKKMRTEPVEKCLECLNYKLAGGLGIIDIYYYCSKGNAGRKDCENYDPKNKLI